MQSFEWSKAGWTFEKMMGVVATSETGARVDWKAVERGQCAGLWEEGRLGRGRRVVEGHELRGHRAEAGRVRSEPVAERRFVQSGFCENEGKNFD